MKPLFLFLVFAALTACNAPSGHNYIPLTATALYNPDSVRLALNGGDEKAADARLAAAIDRYRKNKDTVGSIPLFKDAILLKPTAGGYFELSGALLGAHQYDEAVKALAIAEKLGYTPLANVMFRYAYAYSSLMDPYEPQASSGISDSALRYMQLAVQMGYPHPEEFLRKEYFPRLNAHYEFTKAFNDALSGTAGRNPEKSLWESYLTQYPEVSLPLVVNMEWIKTHRLDDRISYLFENFIPDMRVNKFERDAGWTYYYIALVKKDPVYTAIVYGTRYEDEETAEQEADSTHPAAGAVTTLTPTFYLLTYDPHGKVIDELLVAGRNDLTKPFKAFVVELNMHFQVQDFTDEYKEDTTKGAADSSNYIGIKAQTPVNYLIDATGKFIRTDAPLATR